MEDLYARALAQKAYKAANKNAGLKNNLTATRAPLPTDDKDDGYDVNSTWKYNTHTYTCVDPTPDNAVWSIDSDIASFNTWSELLAALVVTSPSYIGKYAIVANANGAPSAGVTYNYGDTLTDYIVDGGAATLLINNQGSTTYSVTCMPRTIVNPTISSVMLTPAPKFLNRGYYIYTVVPTDGLPQNCNLNDICYFDGSQWSVWQTYAQANTVLVVGSNSNSCIAWRKFQGTFMSTSDDYVPDGQEYQTGKLWNGKAVYRKCKNIILQNWVGGNGNATGLTKPTAGTLLTCMGTASRLTSGINYRFPIGQPGTSVEIYEVQTNGSIETWINPTSSGFTSAAAVVWVEYTKS